MLYRYMLFYLMRAKFLIYLLLGVLFVGCKDINNDCGLTVENVMKENVAKMLVHDTLDGSNLEISDVGFRDVRGYYTFYKNGLLKSYYFIAERDTNASISPTAELIEAD